MGDPVTLSIVSSVALGISGVAAYQANKENRAAYKDQKKANKVRTAAEINADNARKQQAAREARIKRGQILAQSEATGGQGSSSEASSIDLLTTNFGIQTAFMDSQAAASQAVTGYSNDAAKHNLNAQNAQQVMQLSNSIFGATAPNSSLFKG